MSLDTVNPVNVPTEVIFGCAAVVTVPAVAADPDTLPVIVFVTVKLDNVPKLVMLGCAAVGTVNDPAVSVPLTANDDSVPTEVIFGCEAVLTVPVNVVADTALALTVPVAPIPPVTTNDPVLVLELAIPAVTVTWLFAATLVKLPAALVVLPMTTLFMLLEEVGAIFNTLGVIATVALPPLIVTSPLNEAVVATSAEPSSEITT
jgi:hypothetical protein